MTATAHPQLPTASNAQPAAFRLEDVRVPAIRPATPVADCLALGDQGIARVALCSAINDRSAHTTARVTLLCCGGDGNVQIDHAGTSFSTACTDQMSLVLPAGATMTLAPSDDSAWDAALIEFGPAAEAVRSIGADRPTVVRGDAWFIRTCVTSLIRESTTTRHEPSFARWVEMLNAYVARLIGPAQSRGRLNTLWEQVEQRLDHAWTVDELADLAGLSDEHLRRVCQKETGRAPMEQVVHLRMKQACVLLETTDRKIVSVGVSVGYATPAHFSAAFKRVMGCSPHQYRNSGRGW